MKKALLGIVALAILFTSCEKDEQDLNQEQTTVDMSDFNLYTDVASSGEARPSSNEKLKNCFSMANLNRLLDANPGLYKKMYDIEYQTRSNIAGKGKPPSGGGGTPHQQII